MRTLLFVLLSTLFTNQSFAQDTIAVSTISEAIESAKNGNFVSLGLLSDSETNFPEDFFSIPKEKLIGLIIDNCQYTSIPDGIKEYSEIVYFRYSWFLFGDCPLKKFPTFLTQCSNLRHLQIEGLEMTSVPSLSKLTKLESLILTRCGLATFPTSVLDVSSLIALDLACNKFTAIPVGIANLENLESLEFDGGACGGTPISKIPESIGNLTELRNLSFGYSSEPIGTLPSSFYGLKNLEYFGCDGCGISSFSEELKNLKNLVSIHLNNLDSFEAFPEALFSLPKLKRFNFYQYGPLINPELQKQEERINNWGNKLDQFYFQINTSSGDMKRF